MTYAQLRRLLPLMRVLERSPDFPLPSWGLRDEDHRCPSGIADASVWRPEGKHSASFVEIETDAGVTGVGEIYAGVYVPEAAASIVELFKPLIVRQDPTWPQHRLDRERGAEASFACNERCWLGDRVLDVRRSSLGRSTADSFGSK
jgi:hypothetical protein